MKIGFKDKMLVCEMSDNEGICYPMLGFTLLIITAIEIEEFLTFLIKLYGK